MFWVACFAPFCQCYCFDVFSRRVVVFIKDAGRGAGSVIGRLGIGRGWVTLPWRVVRGYPRPDDFHGPGRHFQRPPAWRQIIVLIELFFS